MAKYKTQRIQAYGLTQALPVMPPMPIVAQRAPTVLDLGYEIGTIWVDQVGGSTYILISKSAGGATWSTSVIGANLAVAGTITAGTGITSTVGNITASAGNFVATLGDIVASAGDIAATLGSVTAGTFVLAGTTITATLGDITATDGNIVLGTAGNKIMSTSVGTLPAAGANSVGSVTLAAGTATVATTSVTANSLILVWRQSIGATGAAAIGDISVGTIVAGVSFDINALDPTDATAVIATDVSVAGYMIIN